jgi:hypothetical protein
MMRSIESMAAMLRSAGLRTRASSDALKGASEPIDLLLSLSDAQERAVNELRSRAGVLIAAAITTSFFGSRAITGDGLSLWVWAAVVAFILVGGCVLTVLWPRSDWSFNASAAEIIAERQELDDVTLDGLEVVVAHAPRRSGG